MTDVILDAKRLHADDRDGEALDLLMDAALAALNQDPPALNGEARDVLTDCSYGYLFAMSGQVGVVPDPDGSMESWVREIHQAIPDENLNIEQPRLALAALSYLFNIIAGKSDLGDDFPKVLANAGVFALARMGLAGRHGEVRALAPRVVSWLERVGLTGAT